MTISTGGPGQSGAPSQPQARSIDEELAALLDNEVEAIEIGTIIPSGPATAPGRSVSDGAPMEAGVDIPPTAAEARPIVSPPAPVIPQQPVSPQPPPVYPAPPSVLVTSTPPELERPLPVTQRFGAIIMETAPASTPGGAAALAPQTEQQLAPAVIDGQAATLEGAGVRVAPPGPGTEVEPTPLPAPIDRTPDQKLIVIDRLNQVLNADWQKALHQQIDNLYREVTTEFSSPPDKAERSLVMLREARQLLIDSPEEYVTAEFRTMQVRVILDRMRESRKQSQYYGSRILAYQALWLLGLLLGLIFASPLTDLVAGSGRVTGPALANVYPIINTMIWGGIGGIVGALYTLWWHVSREQDFDRQYLMWYMVQPLMGLVLGGIIFLIMAGGFLILQVNLTDANASTGARLLPYLAAVLAGFRQNFIYEQFDRLIALFTPASKSESGNGGGPAA